MKMTKKIYTSYYANVRNLPPEMKPIGISVGKNKWFEGPYDLRLAPTWAMMKSPRGVYDSLFFKQLAKLDAKKIYDELPDNAVLLCYEVYNDWCHRRAVAEWLERELGIEVCEHGLKREESFPYSECCERNKKVKRIFSPSFVMESKTEMADEVPESVRKRMEGRPMDLFNFNFGGDNS